MLKEFLAIFYTCYLYSTVFLLPVYIIYFVIDPGRFSLVWIHKLHKWIIILTICVPILFAFVMVSSGLVGRDGGGKQSRLNPSINIEASVGFQKTAADGAPMEQTPYIDTFQGYHQMALGVFYCLIDIVVVLSLGGLAVFLFRLLVQRLYIGYIE